MSNTQQRNVVWITIDSVRADHTTMGGYERDTTPNLARIADARAGTWFDTCISQTRWTPASTASILTGTYLSTHGVGVESPEVRPLPSSLETMPELLGSVGYESLGVGTNQYVCGATGMDRGFDRFIFPTVRNLHETVGLRSALEYVANLRRYGPGLTTDKSRHNVSHMVTQAAKRWLSSTRADGTPAFLYLHYNETHYPYTPPPRFLRPYADEIGQTCEAVLETCKRVFDDVFDLVADGLSLTDAEMDAIEAAYDAELAYHDHLIGDLFEYVRTEVPGETVFVVTGDHGETFGEHGWLGHHVLVTDELLHVPMVTHGLPAASGASDGPVQHVDVTRTVLESAGVESSQFEGVNLAESTREYAVAQRAPRWSDREKLLDRNGAFDADRYRWDALNCIHDGEFKFVTGEDGDQLFELPDERTDRSDDHPERTRELADELAARRPAFATADGRRSERATFDDEMRERLANMGYL